jgi:hypothetical protein
MVTIARRWWRSGGNDQRSYFDASACVADALLAGSTTSPARATTSLESSRSQECGDASLMRTASPALSDTGIRRLLDRSDSKAPECGRHAGRCLVEPHDRLAIRVICLLNRAICRTHVEELRDDVTLVRVEHLPHLLRVGIGNAEDVRAFGSVAPAPAPLR